MQTVSFASGGDGVSVSSNFLLCSPGQGSCTWVIHRCYVAVTVFGASTLSALFVISRETSDVSFIWTSFCFVWFKLQALNISSIYCSSKNTWSIHSLSACWLIIICFCKRILSVEINYYMMLLRNVTFSPYNLFLNDLIYSSRLNLLEKGFKSKHVLTLHW